MNFLLTEVRRISNTCIWSWQGWCVAWAEEKSLRQWAMVHALSVALAFTLDLTAGERALVIALGFVLLAAELINSAVEAVVDLASPDLHPLAKKAKDCGSACVALVAMAGGFAWLVILTG